MIPVRLLCLVLWLVAWLPTELRAASPHPSAAPQPFTREEVYCHSLRQYYAFKDRLDRDFGISYEDSLQPGDKVVTKLPMAAATTRPGFPSVTFSLPGGTRVVIVERVWLGELQIFYRVSLPGRQPTEAFVNSAEFTQLATLPKQIEHKDLVMSKTEEFSKALDERLERDHGVTYDQLFREFERTVQCTVRPE